MDQENINTQNISHYKPQLSYEELEQRTRTIKEKQRAFLQSSSDHDSQFENILNQLNQNRHGKNNDFYDQHVNDEYKMLEQGQNKTADLIAVKNSALKTQIKRKTLMMIEEVAERNND